MDEDRRIRYEFRYELETAQRSHESWLTEWSIDWIDDPSVICVVIERNRAAHRRSYYVAIEYVRSPSLNLDWHRTLLARLAECVDVPSVTVRQVSRDQSTCCEY